MVSAVECSVAANLLRAPSPDFPDVYEESQPRPTASDVREQTSLAGRAASHLTRCSQEMWITLRIRRRTKWHLRKLDRS